MSRFSEEERSARKKARQTFYNDVAYNLTNSTFRRRINAFFKLCILLFILIGIPILLFIFCKDTVLNKDYLLALPNRLSSRPILAGILIMFMQMAQIVICVLPGQPFQIAAGSLFGALIGFLIIIIGSILGVIVTYKLAHFLGSDALHLVFGEQRVKDYMRKLNSSRSLMIVFMIYLIPGIPKDLMSYVAGISDMKLKHFLLVSTLGRAPGMFSGILIGMYWNQKNYVGLAIVAVVMLAILYLCYKNKDKIMNKMESLEDKDDEETSAK